MWNCDFKNVSSNNILIAYHVTVTRLYKFKVDFTLMFIKGHNNRMCRSQLYIRMHTCRYNIMYILMCRCTIAEDRTVVHVENTASEELVTDNVTITTSVDSKPATTVAKTRKRLVGKTTPMVAVAVDSTSKPPAAPTVSTLRRQNDLDKQFLANSLKVCLVCVCLI